MKSLASLLSRPNTELPDVLIIGVRKAGTAALRHFLSLHPDLVLDTHEKHFFDHEYNYVRGLQWYASQLPKKRRADQLLVEKTPRYFFYKDAPSRIAADLPKAKLVLVVKEPVSRVVSEYKQFDSTKDDAKTFEVIF